MTHCI